MSNTKINSVIERDCSHGCRSKRHGNILTSVLTKREVSDATVCAYARWLCGECSSVVDSVGRTALHVAASCGRKATVDWLLDNRGALINAKDKESGCTALHRSVFYGQIDVAVDLIRHGIQLNITDNDDLTALEHAMKDAVQRVEHSANYQCEVYMWGSNTNYTLGTGSQHSRAHPELLDTFKRQKFDVSIKQICLRKFHCVMVSGDGKVFSCGHGQGGRLGIDTEQTALIPKQIKFTAPGHPTASVCKQAAIGRDHSVFLMESGTAVRSNQIWTCGLNTHHVLGITPPPDKLLSPRPLAELPAPIKGICAARFHTVAWGPSAVFSWGLNAGQLGHDKNIGKTVISPKQVAALGGQDTCFTHVAASDGATVIVTKRGDIYVLHEYRCRRIASRQLNVAKVTVIGGHLNASIDRSLLMERGGEQLKVLVITNTGNILLWQESSQQLTRCVFSLNRPLVVSDAVLNKNHVLFITRDGEAFQGEVKTKKKKNAEATTATAQQVVKKSAFHEFLNKDDCEYVRVTKLIHVHRAVGIYSDLKGRNFAVIQTDPRAFLIDVPTVSCSDMEEQMLALLKQADTTDEVHDAVFKVDNRLFPVHRFILAHHSEHFETLIKANDTNRPTVELKNVNPDIFEQILLFMYTGTCDLITVGPCPTDLLKLCKGNRVSEYIETENTFQDSTNDISAFEHYTSKKKKKISVEKVKCDIKDPVRLLQEAAKRFGVTELYKKLDNFVFDNGLIKYKCEEKFINKNKQLKFNRSQFPHLFDVNIKSRNGSELSAHKCILAGRLDYFNNLFSGRWNDRTSRAAVSLPISQSIVEVIVDFLYTDEAPGIAACDDIDYLCNVLVIADQLFICRLKEMCEVALANQLTLRNVSQLIGFADIYNAAQLKICCMEFICLNLSAMLESRSLEPLDDDILKDLSRFYCNWNPLMSKRVITPYSDAPTDEEVKSISDSYPVSLDNVESDPEKRNIKNHYKKKTRLRRISSSEKSRKRTDSQCSDKDGVTKTDETIFAIDEIQTAKLDNEKWVKIPNAQEQKQQKLIHARLKVNSLARDEAADCKPVPDNFVNLNANRVSTPPLTSSDSAEFPQLSSNYAKSPPKHDAFSIMEYAKFPPKYEACSVAKSPPKLESKSKFQKLSQKQRKKLAAENNSMSSLGEQLDKINLKQQNNPWQTSKISGELPERVSPEPVPESLKSVWQKCDVQTPIGSPETMVSFSDIIAQEKKMKVNLTRMKAKPLQLTQIEDKAIEELKRFYNIAEASEEYFTIERVVTQTYAVPLWVNSTKPKA